MERSFNFCSTNLAEAALHWKFQRKLPVFCKIMGRLHWKSCCILFPSASQSFPCLGNFVFNRSPVPVFLLAVRSSDLTHACHCSAFSASSYTLPSESSSAFSASSYTLRSESSSLVYTVLLLYCLACLCWLRVGNLGRCSKTGIESCNLPRSNQGMSKSRAETDLHFGFRKTSCFYRLSGNLWSVTLKAYSSRIKHLWLDNS